MLWAGISLAFALLSADPQLPPQVPTAPGVNASTVTAQIEDARRALRENQFDTALQLIAPIVTYTRDAGLLAAHGRALLVLGDARSAKAEYGPATAALTDAVAVATRAADAPTVGRATIALSRIANVMGDMARARTLAARAVTAFDGTDDGRGRVLATLQLLSVGDLSREERRRLMEDAIREAHDLGDRTVEASALQSFGDRLFTDGEYDYAFDMLTRAVTLFEATGNLVALGGAYNSLGRVYRAHGQNAMALSCQLKALALHEKGGDPLMTMQSLNAVASVYRRMGETGKALTYQQRALDSAVRFGSPRVQDFLRANLSGILMDRGDYAGAAALLERVVANGLDTYPIDRYITLSNAYRALGRFDDALGAANRAVELSTRRRTPVDPDIYDTRARALVARGDVTGALADISTGLRLLEERRASLVPSDFFKQRFSYQLEQTYTLAIELQMRQGLTVDALETAELARSRAFLDLLASRGVLSNTEAGAQTAVAGDRNSGPLAAPRAEADPMVDLAIKIRNTATPAGTMSAAPGLPSGVTAVPANATDLRAAASRLRSTLLIYWVGQDQVFIWVVRPDGGIRGTAVPIAETRVQQLVQATSPETREASAPAPPAGRQDSWRELYTLLIKPVRQDLPREPGALLTIVAHGALDSLTFAALQDETGAYLLERYRLNYVPSGGVLRFTAANRHADARTSPVLVVADPVTPRLSRLDQPLPRLPGARAEARSIAGLFPAGRVTLLEGPAATETAVRGRLSQPGVVHFATHAVVRDEDPFGSFIALGASPTDDGLMTAEEMYGVTLSADLVVLSACRSAGGGVVGDGIAAFARALLYAGTPSVVAGLWDVPDVPTSQLVPAFYKAWLAGRSKGEALRDAQLQLLRRLRAGKVVATTAAGAVVVPEHPVFWAGFLLIGEPD